MIGMRPEQIATARDEYERLRPTLVTKYPGQFVAIDPISKEYFIDPVSSVALKKAAGAFPGRDFYTIRIGSDTAFSFSG